MIHSDLDLIDWSEIGLESFEAIDQSALQLGLELECELAIDLPLALADPQIASELGFRLVGRAVEAVGRDWGAVTIGSGVLGVGRAPLAREQSYARLGSLAHVYLEVHSTGPAVGPLASGFASDPFCSQGFPPLTIEKAEALLREFEGELVVDPLATAGASVLLLLPYPAADLPG